MLMTLEQWSWPRTEVAQGYNVKDYLQKACVVKAVTYQVVAQWVLAFHSGQDRAKDDLPS
jgi:hypothetical protein